MGLWGSLIGSDQALGSESVLLANHLLYQLSPDQRMLIAAEVRDIIVRTERRDPEGVLESLGGESRVAQMGFVALACASLGINPFPAPYHVWFRIQNPFLLESQITPYRIKLAASILRDKGIPVREWPQDNSSLDFVALARDGSLVAARAAPNPVAASLMPPQHPSQPSSPKRRPAVTAAKPIAKSVAAAPAPDVFTSWLPAPETRLPHEAEYFRRDGEAPVMGDESPELQKKWEAIVGYYPDLVALERTLAKTSRRLAAQYKRHMIETKGFASRKELAYAMQDRFIAADFGTNSQILVFARALINQEHKEAARELKAAVDLFGDAINPMAVIPKIRERFLSNQDGHVILAGHPAFEADDEGVGPASLVTPSSDSIQEEVVRGLPAEIPKPPQEKQSDEESVVPESMPLPASVGNSQPQPMPSPASPTYQAPLSEPQEAFQVQVNVPFPKGTVRDKAGASWWKWIFIAAGLLIALSLFSNREGEKAAQSAVIYEQVNRAIQADNFQQAYELIQPLANASDPRAQTMLGWLYLHGMGVEKNVERALRYLSMAAEQGDSHAQQALGAVYLKGEHVAQDFKRAREFLIAAANKNDGHANYLLGWIYENGQGVSIDQTAATAYYYKAAVAGDHAGQAAYGWAKVAGQGTNEDYATGVEWLRRAVEAGDEYGKLALALAYLRAEDESNYGEARRLLESSALGGDHRVYVALGDIYRRGRGVAKDPVKAFAYYSRAASLGSSAGNFYVAYMLERGEAGKRDYVESLKHYQQAADSGSVSAEINAASFFAEGKGVGVNYQLAEKMVDSAIAEIDAGFTKRLREHVATEQYPFDIFVLGRIYALGRPDVSADHVLAYTYYLIAKHQGIKMAGIYADNIVSSLSLAERTKSAKVAARWRPGTSLPAPKD